MKKKRAILGAAAAAVLLASVAAGCSPNNPTPAESTPSQPVSQVESGVSSVPSEVESNIPVKSDAEFEEYFKNNPVDKAHDAEEELAYSTVDMVNLANKYSKLWQDEVDAAYQKLQNTATGTEKNQFDDEQLRWSSNETAALEKISQDAQAQGGTMLNLTIATQNMNFYRDRAKQIYRELYNYDQAYSYAFTSNAQQSS